jgi:hypothetical protein
MPSLYGYEIESELPLTRLNQAPGTRGAISISQLTDPPAASEGEPVAQVDAEDGTPLYVVYVEDGRCALKMPPSGWFELDPNAGTVGVLREGGDDELLEHRISSTAICTLLAMRGDLTLHASGVALDGRAVIVCGASWAGKSSLARALGEAGHEVLGEDGIAIDLTAEPIAYPGPRGVRVRSGEGEGLRVDLAPDPGPAEPGPCAIGAVILLLERGDELLIERLDPTVALTRLTQTMIHDGTHDGISASFARLARLLHTVPGFTASLPDDLPELPAAAQDLLDATGLQV